MTIEVQNGDQIEVQIESLEPHGRGVARHGPLVVFIPFVLPGERVLAQITLLKKNFAEASLVQVLIESPERVAAPCSVFQECGGCQWQHISESQQLLEKEKLLAERLHRAFSAMPMSVSQIRKSPQSYFYRNRIQPVRTATGWAFRGHRSHDLIEFSKCWIAEEPINESLPRLAKTAALDRKVEIFINEAGQVQLRQEESQDFENFFAQVNRFQNSDIQDDIRTCVAGFSGNQVFDLCCGAGNFSFVVAESFKGSIIGVDGSRFLIRRAQDLAMSKKLNSRLKFYSSDVSNFLKSVRPNSQSLVILDPPRVGFDPQVMMALASDLPAELIYISCNFVTMVRDLEVFFKNLRRVDEDSQKSSPPEYTWERVQPYEMFPQTSHFEVLVHLRRKN